MQILDTEAVLTSTVGSEYPCKPHYSLLAYQVGFCTDMLT